MDVKPGVQTTEFWLALVTNVVTVVTMVAHVLPPKYGVPVMAGLNGVYAIMRALTKQPDITTFVKHGT